MSRQSQAIVGEDEFRARRYRGLNPAFAERVWSARRPPKKPTIAEMRAERRAMRKAMEAERAAARLVLAATERKLGIDMLRSRQAPSWVVDMMLSIADEYGVSAAMLVGPSRQKAGALARQEFYHRIKTHRPMISLPRIGRWLSRDHTTVMYGLAQHARRTGGVSFTRSQKLPRRSPTSSS